MCALDKLPFALALGTFFSLASVQALAADAEGNYAIRGAGSQSCERYTQDVDNQSDNVDVYLRWLEGYASGINLHQSDTFDAMPLPGTEGIARLVYNVCRQTPDDRLETAAAQMFESIRPARVTASSELVTLEAGDESLQVRSETLRKVQEVLAEAGFYDSTIDGIYGPGTRRAIEAFQEDNEIEASGLPDLITLVLMFVED